MVKLKRESINLTKQNIEKIATIFPSAITPNFRRKLRLKESHYRHNQPMHKTLRLCPVESIKLRQNQKLGH